MYFHLVSNPEERNFICECSLFCFISYQPKKRKTLKRKHSGKNNITFFLIIYIIDFPTPCLQYVHKTDNLMQKKEDIESINFLFLLVNKSMRKFTLKVFNLPFTCEQSQSLISIINSFPFVLNSVFIICFQYNDTVSKINQSIILLRVACVLLKT